MLVKSSFVGDAPRKIFLMSEEISDTFKMYCSWSLSRSGQFPSMFSSILRIYFADG